MPGFDGTGPRGAGPMTGGGRGYCAVPGVPGWGRGFGLRRPIRRGYEQIERLTDRVEALTARLDAQERGRG
jgi:hypothetical protein